MKKEEFVLTEKVKKSIETGEPIDEISSSDGFWYNITMGGYVKVEDLIASPEQIKKIKEALETIEELEKIYEKVSVEF